MASRIVGIMPPRCANPNDPADGDKGWLHYVEPYLGGGSVWLALNPEGISEVVGDTRGDVTNFWNILRDPRSFEELRRACEATPFDEAIFENPNAVPSGLRPAVHLAWDFFVRVRLSLSGRMKGFASITRNRTRRGMNEQVSAWLTAIDGLPDVHARIKRTLVRCKPALELLISEDGPRTLFYLDPPYLHETRVSTDEYGEHEMTPEQHKDLLDALVALEGRFMLSGYRSALYDEYAARWGWHLTEFDVPNHAASGKTKRRMVECVWRNFK